MNNRGTASRAAWHDFSWKIFLASLITIGIIVVVLAVWNFGRVFLLIFAGILFGIFLRGLASALADRTGIRIGIALVIVVSLLALAAVGAAFLAAPHVARQAGELANTLPEAIASLTERFRGIPLIGAAATQVEDFLRPDSGAAGSRLQQMFSATLNTLAASLFVIMIGVYLAAKPQSYVQGLMKLLPVGYRSRTCEVMGAIGHTLRRWLIGQAIIMVIVGVLTAIGLGLVGVPLAMTLGIIAGLLDFIPNLGPWLAAVPGLLIAFHGGPDQGLYAGIVYVAVQHVEGYALTPLVHRKTVRLEPALTLSAQLGFGLTMGILGLLLATPIVAAAMVAVKMLYIEDMLGDKVEVKGEDDGKQLCAVDVEQHQ